MDIYDLGEKMFTKSLIIAVSSALYLSPILAVADETRSCNSTQQGRCGNFCQAHQGVTSCIVDIPLRSGTCNDGTSHTK
jgi:hypothetical protein